MLLSKFNFLVFFITFKVYNIRIESFNHVSSWLTDAKNAAKPDCSICLIGNKSDLREQRTVSYMEAAKFSQNNSKKKINLLVFRFASF